MNENKTIFSTLVNLTSYKLNLLIFFNAIIVLLVQFSNLLIWIFFGDIRIIEQKYVLEKSQKKILQFLLLSIVLRNSFDIYKMLGLAILFCFCILHWLVNKRSDYLISRGSRDWMEHAKIMLLRNVLIVISFIVSYAFYSQFTSQGEALDSQGLQIDSEQRMGKIYVIIGFEFIRLLLKGIQHNFKYHLAAIELYYREQWIEKGFVLNISRFLFDSIILILNCRLFLWLFTSGQFPLYLLGESFDTFIKLYKSAQLFIKSRTLVTQLKSLPSVDLDVPANRQGIDTTCIICLEEMHLAKRLRCGHIFHLSCLRRWIEQNVKCPTCRSQIVLDNPQNQRQQAGDINNFQDENDNNIGNGRRHRIGGGDGARGDGQGAAGRAGRLQARPDAQRRDVRLLMRQQGIRERERERRQQELQNQLQLHSQGEAGAGGPSSSQVGEQSPSRGAAASGSRDRGGSSQPTASSPSPSQEPAQKSREDRRQSRIAALEKRIKKKEAEMAAEEAAGKKTGLDVVEEQEEEEKDIMKEMEEIQKKRKKEKEAKEAKEKESKEIKEIKEDSDENQIKEKKEVRAADEVKKKEAELTSGRREAKARLGSEIDDVIEQIIRAEQLEEKLNTSKDKKKKSGDKSSSLSRKHSKKQSAKPGSRERRHLSDVLHLVDNKDSDEGSLEENYFSVSDKEDAPDRTDLFGRKSAQQPRVSRRTQERIQREVITQELRRMMGEQAHIGSVAYGLPVLAVTRRTLDVQIKAKQVEIVNDKLMRIMRRPQDYVEDIKYYSD